MSVESIHEADPQFPPTEAAPLESLFTESALPSEEPVRTQKEQLATFMYARLRNFNAACQCLSGNDLTEFVNEVRRVLSAAAVKLGGEIAQRRPDSIMCVFSHRAEDRMPTHAKRGLHAAVLTVNDAVKLGPRFEGRSEEPLPPLSLSIGVHLGPGEVTPRATNTPGMVHATGEAVEIARLLAVVAEDLHWSVATSFGTRQAAGSRVDAGRSGTLGLPDNSFLEVVEIAGLVAREGSTAPPGHYEQLRLSLQRNQQLARSAAGGGMDGPSHMLIENYRLLRKIGEGGIATIYLAQPMTGGPPQVLKVLKLDNPDVDLQRFIQEFALLAQIDHPNVARIHRQDFSAGNAYIAMEYFALGDLRARLKRPVDPGIALYYVRQIAAGLEAIHQVGIVHRDLKPDNVMLRQDGMLAIADFGVAKQVTMEITDTGAGDIVGTPYYLSPEQALGRPVDARCDLYSLGVVAYEMLTGGKPYYGDSARELLDLHVNGPVPQLPAPHEWFQPVLDKMMAKDPAQRYASATELLDDLERLGQ
jgi:serine/threonine-protein kinase PpkA